MDPNGATPNPQLAGTSWISSGGQPPAAPHVDPNAPVADPTQGGNYNLNQLLTYGQPDYQGPTYWNANGTPSYFTPTNFNGQTYTDPHSYYQAQLQDALTNHAQATKLANTAYQQGLISYQQQQQALDLSRQMAQQTMLANQAKSLTDYNQAKDAAAQSLHNNLGQISADFSRLSPDAWQTAQTTQEQLTNKQNQQDVGNLGATYQASIDAANRQNLLDTSAYNDQTYNLGVAKDNSTQALTNNQTALDKSYQAQQDQFANSEAAAVKAANDAAQATKIGEQNATTRISPLDLINALASRQVATHNAGMNATQARADLTQYLSSKPFNFTPAQIGPLLDYFYSGAPGGFGKTPLGAQTFSQAPYYAGYTPAQPNAQGVFP
ncbi:MAG: hypothetical protein ACYDBV_08585 [Nitrospiria bacterium]